MQTSQGRSDRNLGYDKDRRPLEIESSNGSDPKFHSTLHSALAGVAALFSRSGRNGSEDALAGCYIRQESFN